MVNACLCEVSRLSPPEESDRNPTWFSVEKAKQRLRQDRAPNYGAELARVLDRAVARIRRLGGTPASPGQPQLSAPRPSDSRPDPLRRVQFIDAPGPSRGAPRLAAMNRTIVDPPLDKKKIRKKKRRSPAFRLFLTPPVLTRGGVRWCWEMWMMLLDQCCSINVWLRSHPRDLPAHPQGTRCRHRTPAIAPVNPNLGQSILSGTEVRKNQAGLMPLPAGID